MIAFVLFLSGNSMAQCPGITPAEFASIPPLGLDYTINVTNQGCSIDGAIVTTLNEPLPTNVFIFYKFPGQTSWTQGTLSDLNISLATPGTYSTAFIDFSNGEADICQFDLLDNTCPGDYTGDGFITVADLAGFLGEYGGACTLCCGDFNNDGFLTVTDYIAFFTAFGTSCTTPLPMSSSTSALENSTMAVSSENIKEVFSKLKAEEITIYPNPSSGNLNIKIENVELNSDNNVTIIDATGRIIQKVPTNYDNNQVSLNVENLAPGTYYVLVITEKNSYSESFVVK